MLIFASARDEWNALSEIGDLVAPGARNRGEFIKECQDGKLDGVVAAYRTFDSVALTGVFDEELCRVLPKSLKYLGSCGRLHTTTPVSDHLHIRLSGFAHFKMQAPDLILVQCPFSCSSADSPPGAGYDPVIPGACSSRDPPLLVSNVPKITEDATSDTAMFLLLGALRNFNVSMVSLRKGDWRGKSPPSLGHDPRGKTLGILGMGGIGRKLKKKAGAFGMRSIYHNRSRLDPKLEDGANYVTFEELLKQSDAISLNLPSNPKTKHIISTDQFKLMKPTAVIINTARGAVMDESALVDALTKGEIAGAALDVYQEEPKIHPGLVENDKVMLLPHMGTWTSETQKEMEIHTIDNIRSALTGKGLLSLIPEQKDQGLDQP